MTIQQTNSRLPEINLEPKKTPLIDKIETKIKKELKQEQKLLLKLSSHSNIQRKDLHVHQKIKLEQQIQQTLTKYTKPKKSTWRT